MKKYFIVLMATVLFACNNEQLPTKKFNDLVSDEFINAGKSLILMKGSDFNSLFNDLIIIPDTYRIDNHYIRFDFMDVTGICPPFDFEHEFEIPKPEIDIYDPESIIAVNAYCLETAECAYITKDFKLICGPCEREDYQMDLPEDSDKHKVFICSCNCSDDYNCVKVKYYRGNSIYCLCMKNDEIKLFRNNPSPNIN